MAEEFKITKEIMEKADTYISLPLKEMISSDLARVCVKETYQIHQHDEKPNDEAMYGLAPNYCESPSTKARVMMSILMTMYLHVWGEDTPFLCEVSDYDNWAGAHVLNQLERFKAGEYREKAFDILADYREMERYMNSAIYAVLRELNDPVKRFMDAIGKMTTADAMQDTLDKISEIQQELEAEQERQEHIIHGEEDKAGEESD